jgi:hypothetical protein
MASENIDGTTGGTGLFNTAIPSLSDNANIQEALRIYHYGLAEGNSTIPTEETVNPKSIAGNFKLISNRVSTLESTGIGSKYSDETTLPEIVPDGFLWVDSQSSSPTFNNTGTQALSVARYQNDMPTGIIPDGALWVDKNSSPLTMYVYDSTLGFWREIGGEES